MRQTPYLATMAESRIGRYKEPTLVALDGGTSTATASAEQGYLHAK